MVGIINLIGFGFIVYGLYELISAIIKRESWWIGIKKVLIGLVICFLINLPGAFYRVQFVEKQSQNLEATLSKTAVDLEASAQFIECCQFCGGALPENEEDIVSAALRMRDKELKDVLRRFSGRIVPIKTKSKKEIIWGYILDEDEAKEIGIDIVVFCCCETCVQQLLEILSGEKEDVGMFIRAWAVLKKGGEER